MKKKPLILFAILVPVLAVSAGFIVTDSAYADALADAIASAPQGTEKGQIDPAAAPGFLGIPGGPDISLIIGFFGRSGSAGYFRRWALSAASWPVSAI